MEKIKFFFISLIILAVNALYSQDNKNKWIVGTSTHVIDNAINHLFFKEHMNIEVWDKSFLSQRAFVGYSILENFSINLNMTISYINDKKNYWSDIENEYLTKLGLTSRFYPFTHKIFDPYIKIGFHQTKFNINKKVLTLDYLRKFRNYNKVFSQIEYGYGFNIWFVKKLGLFFESSYNIFFGSDAESHDFYQHNFGIVYKFNINSKKSKYLEYKDKYGNIIISYIQDYKDKNECNLEFAKNQLFFDKDADGIYDYYDACPKEPGLKKFNGCPDSDSDGIPDDDDICPKEPGLKEFNGCPDSDNDGIPDYNDSCIKEPGSKEFNGCPDSDGDGIIDTEDHCPKKHGLKNLNGCPDPKVIEIKKKFKKEEKKVIKINSVIKNIIFNFDKSNIKEKNLKNIIKKIAKQINKKLSKGTKLYIDGHTDDIGSTKYNEKLSLYRANYMKKLLIKYGVKSNCLVIRGFGKRKPKILKNKTYKEKRGNRRVEISIK